MVCGSKPRVVGRQVGRHSLFVIYPPELSDEALYEVSRMIEMVKEDDRRFHGAELAEMSIEIEAEALVKKSAKYLIGQLERCLERGENQGYLTEVLKTALVIKLMRNGYDERESNRAVNTLVRLFRKVDALDSDLSHQSMRLMEAGKKYRRIRRRIIRRAG